MKKICVCIVILCLAASMSFAQNPDLINSYKNGIESFAEDLGAVLPLTSVIGLSWNDAYIGDVLEISPHFGIGFTAGFSTLPFKRIKSLVDNAMGGDADDIPEILRKTGIPIPAATIDARIAGFPIPLDIGLKFGYFNFDSDDLNIDYLLVGGDVRYCVLEQAILIPKISVGGGFNFMKADLTMSGALDDGVMIDTSSYSSFLGGANSLILTSPDLYIEMATKVIDFKVQASWKALIFEPSIGLGASYGMSKISAGAKSHLYADMIGNEIGLAQKNALEVFGFDVDNDSIGFTKNVNLFAYRLFGGIGLNMMIVHLDLGLMYGLNSQSWGASFGGRIQL